MGNVGWLNASASELRANELLCLAQKGDRSAIQDICQGLYASTAGRLGTNDTFVKTIINGADSETLASIMDNYSAVTGSEIYKDIENDFSGKTEQDLIAALENAYQDAHEESYTGWDDGQLNNKQIAEGVFEGLKNKAAGIGLIAAGTIAAPYIATGVGAALGAVFGAAAAATIAAVAAPVLAVAGIAAAGYMIYKGVTQTASAIEEGKNSKTDAGTMSAVQKGTEGVIDTAEGAYIGAQSIRGLVQSAKNIKNIKTQKAANEALEAEARSRYESSQRELRAVERNNQAIYEMQNPTATSNELQARADFQNEYGGYSAQESAKFFEAQEKTDVEIKLDKLDKIDFWEDDRIFGYEFDGAQGSATRSDIREHFLSQFGLSDESYQVKALDTNLGATAQLSQNSKYYALGEARFNSKTNEYTHICEHLRDMPDYNGVRGKNPLFGRNVKGIKFRLGKIQDAGIGTIIDLRAAGECSNKAMQVMEEMGIEYVNFPIEDGVWTQDSLGQITEYIKTVNKGDFYVGCANGEARTDLAVGINYLLNPEADCVPEFYFGTESSTRVSVKQNLAQILDLVKANQSIVKDWGWSSYTDFAHAINTRFATLIQIFG